MKNIILRECPCYQDGVCMRDVKLCMWIKDCKLKLLVRKPFDRVNYVQNKLSSCLGYNSEQKKLRYEEQNWIAKEMKNILGIMCVEEKN